LLGYIQFIEPSSTLLGSGKNLEWRTKILVNEIFLSLQGEGIHSGVPTVFIRLQGCNLAKEGTPCVYCDTAYAQSTGDGGIKMTLDQVLRKVKKVANEETKWICITGGEPLLQRRSLPSLVTELHALGYKVEVETNGTLRILDFDTVDSWSVDIKCPSSRVPGPTHRSWLGNSGPLRSKDQIKFVVGNEEDLKFTLGTVNHRRLQGYQGPQILVSPVCSNLYGDTDTPGWDRKWLQTVWDFCVENGYRFSLQQHKLVWRNQKGV
jgi:7-carboxy-7-deazaguanine synthase